MIAARWRRISELVQAAIERPAGERNAYLSDACATDRELRREVESLLSAHGRAADFLERAAGSSPLSAGLTVAEPPAEWRLAVGAHLGHFEILGRLGAGGMGEVYRARDARLNRTVAIKILPAHLAAHPELRQRLEREAVAISGLNHPNICTLHDVGHEDGVDFIVMQYVEGDTLDRRLARGALPVHQVLRVAVEIADALAVAHTKGVIHRDLKPSNVMLTKSGAKLLDFGLAKLRDSHTVPLDGATRHGPLTGDGAILGTLQYMAPEQLEGRDTDARSDIFTFGAIVYEMATGRRAFEGTSQASVIAAILEHDPPPMAELQSLIPPSLDWIVGRCLAKDADDRWQSCRDLGAALKRVAVASETASGAGVVKVRRSPSVLAWSVAATLGVALFAGAFVHFRGLPPPTDVIRLSMTAPDGWHFSQSNGFLAASHDGHRIAFVATDTNGKRLLWVRPLGESVARPITGTDEASFPFWAPDSEALGFFAQGKLKRVDLATGTTRTVCEAPEGRGGTWNRGGTIVFSPSSRNGPLYRVAATGGVPVVATALDEGRHEVVHFQPQFLPDGQHFVYAVQADGPTVDGLHVGSLESVSRQQLLSASWKSTPATAVEYMAPGYLLFVREGILMAQPFDATHLRLSGEATPVVDAFSGSIRGMSAFSVSNDGMLVHRSGLLSHRLVWFTREGRSVGPSADAVEFSEPSLSPDGTRATFLRFDPRNKLDIWMWDIGRDVMSRFTFSAADDYLPVWSPDGTRIAYASQQRPDLPNMCQVYLKPASGAVREELLLNTTSDTHPDDWAPDGRSLVIDRRDPNTGQDLWILSLFGDRKAFPFLQTRFNEGEAQFSPDGHWIAYASDESGTWEVYVQPIPANGAKWQVSTAGGAEPRWRRDGKEIFYVGSNRKLMVAVVRAGASLQFSTPKPLFDVPIVGQLASGWAAEKYYAVTADGQRFLVNIAVEDTTTPITVELNWTAGLKK